MSAGTLLNLGFYISTVGFLVATIISATATDRFGKSTFGAVFTYLFIGTGILFVCNIFQRLGGSFFAISDDSLGIWYHIMFFMSVFSYHYGYMAFVGLGSGTVDGTKGREKQWGLFVLIFILAVFFFAGFAEPVLGLFLSQPIAGYGFLHFFSFAFAAIIGSHFLSVKLNLGKIGQAIAYPMFLALWSLAIIHLWELLSIIYKIVPVTFEFEQGVEKSLLIIASICVIVAALRLKSVART